MTKRRLHATGVVIVACAIGATLSQCTMDGHRGAEGRNCPVCPGTPSHRTSRPAATGKTTHRGTRPAGGATLVKLDIGLGADAVTRATPGNPRGVKPPHLRAKGRRPPFMVRPGMTNLALYKPVSASEEPVIGDVDQITDGLKKSGQFDYVEIGPGLGWVQVDLGKLRTVHAVVIWHYYKNATIYNDVIVRLADDPEMARNVTTVLNNDHDNSARLGKGDDKAFYTRWWGEIADARGDDGKGTPGRYVRVYTADGMENEPVRFVEIAVYGKGA